MNKSTDISFEFFPPKTDAGMNNLLQTAKTLADIKPGCFSVTFGAAGSAQTHTPDTVFKIQEHTAIPTTPHISCVAATKEMTEDLLEKYISNNITRLVVLRGDIPSDEKTGVHHFQFASELVAFIRQKTGDHFHISVACYPEYHPQTTNHQRALMHFKEKIDAGANNAITQYFYNADAYFRLRDSCRKLNIHTPLIPGIMPIVNYEKLVSFSNACGAEIPRWLLYRLESFQHDAKSFEKFSEEVVSHLCEKLTSGGAPGLHFYTLNKAEPSIAILKNLGLHQSQRLNL
ncbi:MAG: methylenetetrahydrofolate reductase [NAD(P)H], partial [Gammaproteobacteria bacterium]|nr:methylenetetrahydrofolate reductase [NAD(P)H] [Gammaproteobacteria bacterium]